jgi:DNA repair photolyase
MGLNIVKGNMYDFITHTWNTVKGACPHGCTYCYMRRFGEQKPVRFDAKELKADLGAGNFIFVGSSCDMFAEAIPHDWIVNTLTKMNWYENRYLLQSKNPARMERYLHDGWIVPAKVVVCTTIETNRVYPCTLDAPTATPRAKGMELLAGYRRFVTIEPIMDFDLEPLIELIKRCGPEQVNIGADSGGNHLPEPPAEKVLALIEELGKFTTIARKTNLGRILGA